MPASDILTRLAPCDISVTYGGQTHVIAAMNAHEWLQVLLADRLDPYTVFPMLAGADAVIAVEDSLDRLQAPADDVYRAGWEVVSVAGGRPWWVTLRILGVAAEVWDRIGGTLVREGVDARELALAAWLDALWSILCSYVDPAKKASWLHQIESAPAGWDQEIDFDEQERAFLAAMRSVM